MKLLRACVRNTKLRSQKNEVMVIGSSTGEQFQTEFEYVQYAQAKSVKPLSEQDIQDPSVDTFKERFDPKAPYPGERPLPIRPGTQERFKDPTKVISQQYWKRPTDYGMPVGASAEAAGAFLEDPSYPPTGEGAPQQLAMEARKEIIPIGPKGHESGGGPVSRRVPPSPDSIKRAEDLEKKGVSPQEIERDTGLFRRGNSPAGRGGTWHHSPESERYVEPNWGPMSDATPDEVKAGQQYAMEARKDPFPLAPRGSEAGGGPVPIPLKNVTKEAPRFGDPDEKVLGSKYKDFMLSSPNERLYTFEHKGNAGILQVKPRKYEDKNDLYIGYIGAGGSNKTGVTPGERWSVGPDAVREVFKSLVKEFPQAQTITGFRVSGARQGKSTMITRNITDYLD